MVQRGIVKEIKTATPGGTSDGIVEADGELDSG